MWVKAMGKMSATLIGASAIALVASAANAQTQTSDDAQARLDGEIIVTATRRAERLQDVPLAVTAITGEDLVDRGVQRLEDYIRLVPGLAYNTTGPAISNVFVRGITTSNQAITQSSTVGFYIDESPIDISYGGRSTVDLRTFDLERIEVLRGPQGTLFGSGSLSGTVRLITAKPKLDEFQAIAEITQQHVEGGQWGGDYNAAVNVPVVAGKFAIRAAGYYVAMPGYVDNIQTGARNVNDGHAAGGRAIARFKATDDLTIDAMLVHQVSRPNNDGRTFYTPVGGNDYSYQGRIPDTNRSRYTLGSLTVNAGLGFADLISITSYSKKNVNAFNDDTGRAGVVALVFFGAASVPGLTTNPTQLTALTRSKFFTQEVRLSSSNSDIFKWTVGGYYSDKKGGFLQSLIGPDFARLQPAAVPGGNLLTVDADITQKEKSVFGELTFTGIPKVEITAGGRYFDTRLTFDLVRSGRLFGLAAPVTDPQDVSKEDGFNPKVAISFKPSRNVNIYAQAAKGFRTGGFNSGATLGTIQRAYSSDSLWNYEAGIKSSVLNGVATINIAGYIIDWKDVQVGLQQGGFSYTNNSGKARAKGVELEATIRPSRSFSVGHALSISRSELTTNVPFLLQSSGVLGAFKGDRLPGSPELTASTYAQLDLKVAERPVFFRVDHQYVGEAFSGFRETGQKFGDYNLINLRAGVTVGPVEAIAFVNNLLDEHKPSNALDRSTLAGQTANPAIAFRLQPRTIGLTLRARL